MSRKKVKTKAKTTKIIAMACQAGGMGKTSLVVNLGYHLHLRGHRILLVDMDGQASLTRHAGVASPDNLPSSIFDVFINGADLPVIPDVHGMDWVPTSGDLYTLDISLGRQEKAGNAGVMLKGALQGVQKNYDFILIDCPPALDMKSTYALVAATHFLVPLETSEKGIEGIDKLLNTVENVMKTANPRIRPAGVIPNMYDAREVICKKSLEDIQKMFGDVMTVFPPIPRRTDFKHAWMHKIPLKEINPSSDALKIFERICNNLEAL